MREKKKAKNKQNKQATSGHYNPQGLKLEQSVGSSEGAMDPERTLSALTIVEINKIQCVLCKSKYV